MAFYAYHEWYQAFYKCWLDIMSDHYVIMHDEKTFHNSKITQYPQPITAFAIISYLPGSQEYNAKPNVDTSFNSVT